MQFKSVILLFTLFLLFFIAASAHPKKVFAAFGCGSAVNNCTGQPNGTLCYINGTCAQSANQCCTLSSFGSNICNWLHGCENGTCVAGGGNYSLHQTCQYGCDTSTDSCNPPPRPTPTPTPTPRPQPTIPSTSTVPTLTPTPSACHYCGPYTTSEGCSSSNASRTCYAYDTDGTCNGSAAMIWGAGCAYCDACSDVPITPDNPITPPPPTFICHEGVVQGYVYFDTNQNGNRDAGENLVGGVTVSGYLQSNPSNDWTEQTDAITQGGYDYEHQGLETGVWVISIPSSMPGIYRQVTTPNPSTRTNIDSCGDHDEQDFGVYQPGPTPTTPAGDKACAVNINSSSSGSTTLLSPNDYMNLTVNYVNTGWGHNDYSFHKIIEWFEKDPLTGAMRLVDNNDCAKPDGWDWTGGITYGTNLGTFNPKCNLIRASDGSPNNNTTWTANALGNTILVGHMFLSYDGTDDRFQEDASRSHAFCETPKVTVKSPATPTPTPAPIYSISGAVFIQGHGRYIDASNPTVLTLGGADSKYKPANALGNYSFDKLEGGLYTVRITPPQGYHAHHVSCSGGCRQLGPGLASMTIPPNQTNVDFYIEQDACISGYVWDDINGNGGPDAGESGFPNVTVTANGPSTGSGTSRATPDDGLYDITELLPGSYNVTVSSPLGYVVVNPENPSNPNVKSVVTSPGLPCAGANFYLAKAYTIQGSVFIDKNANAIKDSGESDYTDSTIIQAGVQPAKTFSGQYRFDLTANAYAVHFTTPSGYFLTNPTNTYIVSIGPPPQCNPDGHPEARCNTPLFPGNIIDLNFGITNEAPWFQGVEGDMRLDNGFTDYVPAVPADTYASLVGPGGYHGVIFAGSTYTFGIGPGNFQDRASRDQWVAGETAVESFTPANSGIIRTSYGYLLQKAQQSGATFTPAPDSCKDSVNGCTFSNRNGLFQATGSSDYYLNTTTFDAGVNKGAVILVDGNLHIIGEVHVAQGSTLTFSASKDIIVDKSIGNTLTGNSSSNLEGFFSTDKNFTIDGTNDCTIGADKRLNIQGVVIANASLTDGSVLNNRNLCQNNQNPSYYIEQRLDMILNAPQFLKHSNYSWREVAP